MSKDIQITKGIFFPVEHFMHCLKDTCFCPWYLAVYWTGNVIGFVYFVQNCSFVLMSVQ